MFYDTMKNLIDKLNKASYAYYNTENPIMSDLEFDKLMDTLKEMERESGIIMSNSPTQKVGAPVLNELKKVKIEGKPMLSLDKVHSAEEVFMFAKNKKILGLIKCDGLSTRLIYENGKLVAAHTRGNGYEGSDVTEHVKCFLNVPLTINTTKRYVVDGESVIKDSDFSTLEGFKNARNAASGALSLLDINEVKKRKLSFILWDVIEGDDDEDSLTERLNHAFKLGFEVVNGGEISSKDLSIEKINKGNEYILNKAKEKGIPCDGVVWKFDSISYGDKMGSTSHHFNNGIAWKPEVEVMTTKLRDIEWTMGRTGILTPVAIFDTVDLDGSEVSRASLHNITVLKDTLHGMGWVGQEINVFKANMIIPQIAWAQEDDEYVKHYIDFPHLCPICNKPTSIKKDNDSEFLVCTNPSCEGQLVNKLEHFAGKKGLDIKHLSKATLEKLINWNWIENFEDIFLLKNHREEWINKTGFGVASVDRLLNSIEESKNTQLDKVIAAAGIPLVGTNVAKQLHSYINSWDEFRDKIKQRYNWAQYDGIGDVMCNSINNFNYDDIDAVIPYLNFIAPKDDVVIDNASKLQGKVFCVTGKVHIFKNRAELIANIEANGGKAVSAMSSKVNYLINNDINSTSSKNIQAKKAGIPIISEEDYLSLC